MIRHAVAICLSAAAPAHAADWEVVPERSEVLFDYVLDDNSETGAFDRVSGTGRLDLADPQGASLRIVIAADSIDLGRDVFSAYATSAEWFDAQQFPEVVYQLNRLDPTGGESFMAQGDLTIRGRTVALSTPVQVSIEGTTAHAAGTLTVNRREFLLGVGPAELFVDVADAVSVRFDLIARRISP